MVDFGDKDLEFKDRLLGEYDFTTIDANIKKYQEYKESVFVSGEFKKIFESVMFQSMLRDENNNNITNLLDLYNGLVKSGVLDDSVLYRELGQREFIRMLKRLGYETRRTTKYINGKTVGISRVVKVDEYEGK